MLRRSCLANLIIAENLITCMTDLGELVDVVYLDFSKAFDSVYHPLLDKKMVAMGIHREITRWMEGFLKIRTFRVKLGSHLSSEGGPQCSVIGHLLFLIFKNDLTDELTGNHLFFTGYVKLIASR